MGRVSRLQAYRDARVGTLEVSAPPRRSRDCKVAAAFRPDHRALHAHPERYAFRGGSPRVARDADTAVLALDWPISLASPRAADKVVPAAVSDVALARGWSKTTTRRRRRTRTARDLTTSRRRFVNALEARWRFR